MSYYASYSLRFLGTSESFFSTFALFGDAHWDTLYLAQVLVSQCLMHKDKGSMTINMRLSCCKGTIQFHIISKFC